MLSSQDVTTIDKRPRRILAETFDQSDWRIGRGRIGPGVRSIIQAENGGIGGAAERDSKKQRE